MLHVNAKNKGVLLPSIALTSDTDAVTVPSPADGLIVWNNGKAGLAEAGFIIGLHPNGTGFLPLPIPPVKRILEQPGTQQEIIPNL
jgi:hypothetical protein